MHGPATISDGGNLSASPPVRPFGQMPFLPTHFILAKNVRITANYSHDDQTFVASQFSASASVGWGPFSVSGTYSESTSEQSTQAHFDGATFIIDQPQIIAFTGTLLPMSPNPLPRSVLPWGDDAWLPEDHPNYVDPDVQLASLEYLAALRAEGERLDMLRDQANQHALDDSLRQQRVIQSFKRRLRDEMQVYHEREPIRQRHERENGGNGFTQRQELFDTPATM
jgi:hypothetical protein